MGGGGGEIFAIWVSAVIKCNVSRHFWVQKSLNKKRSVTSTRTQALEYFLFQNGILRWGIWELGLKSFLMRSLDYTLVYPYLTYCVSVWGSTYRSNLNRIIILQKKIIRIISKVSFDAHTGVLFKEQEILKFSDIYLYQIGKFMYLFKRGLLPNYFRDMFTLASQIHSYNTRNSSLFYIPHCRTNFRKFSIRFQGPTFFNSLSREIQNSESISLFAKRLVFSCV